MKIDLKNCTINIKDGATGDIEVNVGTGNVSWTERMARTYELNKGLLDTVRNGDQAPVDVNLSFNWEWLKSVGAELPTPVEALKRIGAASAWVSTDDDPCAPYAVDIVIEHTIDCTGEDITETITLPDFRVEELSYDISAGQITCTGKCNVTEISVTRTITTD